MQGVTLQKSNQKILYNKSCKTKNNFLNTFCVFFVPELTTHQQFGKPILKEPAYNFLFIFFKN